MQMRRLLLLMLAVFVLCAQLLAQTRTVTGTIQDNNGQPLPGVSIKVIGEKMGTTTDSRGSFNLKVSQSAKTLEFSSVGFATQTVAIPSSGSMTISLSLEEKSMAEVVVTGITRTKRSQYAGAATKIDEVAIKNRPVGSFDQLLQGRVPGLLSLTSSGQPGSAATTIIRGQGSIQGGSDPLYVVDGIAVEGGVFQSLNPNDFESIDILRDASATALYGSRGSAGVIVVTTRRGQGGKMKVSYSGQAGVKSRPEFTRDMMTTAELLKAQEDYGSILELANTTSVRTNMPGWYYSKNNPAYATLTAGQKGQFDATLDSISKINTDWRDVFFRNGNFQNHQISLSGGTGKTRIYSSFGLYNEEGTTLRTDMKRATLRNNVDYADDRFTLGLSTHLGYTKRNFQQSTVGNNLGNPFLVANVTAPYTQLYNPDGAFATGTGSQFTGANTYELTELDENYNDQVKAIFGVNAAYRITNSITAALTSGADFRETQTSSYGSKLAYTRRTSTTPTGSAGFQSEGLTRFLQLNVRPSVNFRQTFNTAHDVDVTVFGEYINQFDKSLTGTGYGIDPRTPNTPAAITQGDAVNRLYANVGGGKGENAILSGLAIGRYTYNGKYTVTGSYRRDGSSKLPESTRWTNYYSVGAIWEATKEAFMMNSDFVNTLRLKVSYGGAGNYDNFPGGNYPYQPQYAASGTYAGLPLQVATYPGNPDMTWESTWVTNVGVDYGFLKNRIWGDLNLYDKRTKDLFVQKKLSAVSGFGSLDVNAGELQNKGVEFSLNGDVVRNKDITWTVFGNVAYNKNEVLSLGGETSFEQGTELITVGLPLGSHYEVKWAGVDAATGQPLYYGADGKVTPNYNDAPAVQEFGTWEAPWKGGFGSSVRYKGLELSALFSWQKGANKVDNMEYFMENPVGFIAGGYNQANTLNFWKKPGDVVSTPSPLYSVNFSSKIIHNADFLRLRDVTLAYALPKQILERTRFISNARLFVQGTNLKMWTNWLGMDPEAGATNINLSEYPNPRAVTAGLDISF
jgi:TonB-linked SusC/RagA family outer membrane protein